MRRPWRGLARPAARRPRASRGSLPHTSGADAAAVRLSPPTVPASLTVCFTLSIVPDTGTGRQPAGGEECHALRIDDRTSAGPELRRDPGHREDGRGGRPRGVLPLGPL